MNIDAFHYQVAIDAICSELGGVDYEGLPTSRLNYLKRIRILREKERRLTEAEDLISEIYHHTDCTTKQYELIEDFIPRKTNHPECSGNPNCCPENSGFGCCGRNPRNPA